MTLRPVFTPAQRALDRDIARLAIPALGALIAEPLFLLIDSAMIGHLGQHPLAGLAIASTILQTIVGLMIFLAYAATPHVARKLGEGNPRGALESGVDGMWLAGLCGVVLALAGISLSEWLVTMFTIDPLVATPALEYLQISLYGLPGMLLVLAATGVLRGLQDTRTPLVISVTGFGANAALNAVLIYGFGLGVAGAAIGTVVVQWGMAVWMGALVVNAALRSGATLSPRWMGIGDSAKDGGWLLVRTLSLRITLIATVAAASTLGSANLAGYQILFTLFTAIALALDSLAVAAQAMIGKFLGEGNPSRVRELSQRLRLWALTFGLVCAVVICATSPFLARVFTSDPAVLAVMPVALFVMGLSLPVSAYAFILDGILIGAADMRYLAVSMLLSLVCFVPILWQVQRIAQGAEHPLAWIWVAFGFGLMLLRSLTLGIRLHNDRWLHLARA